MQVNDLVRDKLMDKKGNLPLWAEVLSGGCVSYLIFFTSVLVYHIYQMVYFYFRLEHLKLFSQILWKLLKSDYK